MKNILLILLLLSTGYTCAQIQSVTFQPDNSDGHDAYVNSSNTSTNYGGYQNFRASTRKGTIPFNPPINYDYYERAFIKFEDLSSIPSNAVVLEAKIHLSRYNASYSSGHTNAAYLTPISGSSWDESFVNFNNMPVLSNFFVAVNHDASISSVNSSSEVWEVYDVTNTVSAYISNPSSNEGWELRIGNEDPSGTTYSNIREYRSSEYTGDASRRPKLEVKYYLPPPEITGTVTHCDFDQENGAIDVTVSGGNAPYASYDWYDGQTDSYFATTEDVSDLAPGWYGLKVEDDEGIIGTQIFVVGEECNLNSVTIDPPEDFSKDLFVESGPGGDPFFSGSSLSYMRNGTLDLPSSGGPNPPAIYYHGLWGFDVQGLWDSQGNPIFTISSAKALLTEHNRTTHPSIEIYGKLITQQWDEQNTTYNNAPNYSSVTSEWEYYNFTTIGSEERAEIDVLDYFDDDGEFSFYSFLDFNGVGYPADNSYFWDISSASSSTPVNKPILKVTFGESCNACAVPKYEVEGNFYYTDEDKLCVFYNNEYHSDQLEVRIYSANYFVLRADNSDFPDLLNNYRYGENKLIFDFSNSGMCLGKGMYIMELENEKGEIQYLKFVNEYSGCIPEDDDEVAPFNFSPE